MTDVQKKYSRTIRQKDLKMVIGGPANIPNDSEKDNGDDVNGAGQLPQPVVGVHH